MRKIIPAREWTAHGTMTEQGLWAIFVACPTKARKQGTPMFSFVIDESETPQSLANKIAQAMNLFEIGLAAPPQLVAHDGFTPLDESA